MKGGIFCRRLSRTTSGIGGPTEVHLAIVPEPFRRVAMARVDVFQGNGEMNEIKVKIF